MKSFKNRAGEKQRQFIAGKTEFAEHFILRDNDALHYQLVPWEGLQEEIEKRRKIKDKKGVVKIPFRNMLRSEHIPCNIFIPLKLHKNKEQVLSFFKELLKRNDLQRITEFEIEWAPTDPKDVLDDKTSFDTYIQFELPETRKLGVGIEVKFTEKSYPFTKTEKYRLETENETSPYYTTWKKLEGIVFSRNSFRTLGKKEYKQLFRNHLLGLSMLNNHNTTIRLDEFICLHVFPEGNHYQSEKAMEYSEYLMPEAQKGFRPVTFKEFIGTLKLNFIEPDNKPWLDYLEARYII